ncbi:DUF4177 domain-containing protein [Halobium palmae]|uniref:DUF4177 domain-containing protein n=1 Tax=Halobium palmae TaxID=1776492 RepID=A0ABD5RZP5_9EURY
MSSISDRLGGASSGRTSDYEYKVVSAPTSTFWFRIKHEETERLLNELAADGWELDEAVVNWWGGADLILRRER